ncbi:NUDIX domain-containing protein [Pseudalkalibacillus salsuginis]|uniref:NUDIX domain-containing protein n=1 Tax=Pseudalkalibacillus salsuginis TaxID=2910972 RepID=UPI001F30D0D6|nr:NUDIX hydrolase [Pseudalkalibacillus salsuginis]MCF6408313.1 NUDIX hydrolase [Pseudalkalibacillus salsuginis]
MKKLEEKTINSEVIYNGRIIDLHLEEVELPDGKTSQREVIKHPGAVAILAITSENKIVLVRQYRKPLNREIIEIPAGKLEKGEIPEVCAHRELEEETGYRSKELTYLQSFYTSPGFADELIHIFYTDQLEQGEVQLDQDEFVERMEVTLEEAIELVKTQEIYDAKTAFAIQYLQLKDAGS